MDWITVWRWEPKGLSSHAHSTWLPCYTAVTRICTEQSPPINLTLPCCVHSPVRLLFWELRSDRWIMSEQGSIGFLKTHKAVNWRPRFCKSISVAIHSARGADISFSQCFILLSFTNTAVANQVISDFNNSQHQTNSRKLHCSGVYHYT